MCVLSSDVPRVSAMASTRLLLHHVKTLSSAGLSLAFLLHLFLTSVEAHSGHDEDSGDAAGSDKPDLHARGLILVKIWCLIIMLVTTFAGGVSPYFFRWNESFLLLGTQFAGGVFLGTSLMHFLSDANETFGDLTDKTYPFAFMLACSGYLLTMLGDCVIMYVARSSSREVKVEVAAEEGGGRRSLPSNCGRGPSGMDGNPIFLQTTSFGDTVLLILALCFHSVFEGIAIGVSGKNKKKIILSC